MSALDDLSLLRAYEPVVRFTRGEYFFPVSTERYVGRAALWGEPVGGNERLLAESGQLDLDALAVRSATDQGLGSSLSGIFMGSASPKVRLPGKERPPRLKGGGRLAAVGLLARSVDGLNRASLVFRGSVPGGSAARAFVLQRDHLAPEQPTYYGRVLRDGHWIVCQYWFFYAFNNWRSAFGGVNEHEADWEQVTVYLDGAGEVDDAGLPRPRWVVFSAHDETGDDLRRRWDDPDLTLVDGRHPVVFAGAGSHSGAYLAGDYLITVPAQAFGPVIRALRWFGRLLAPWASSGGDDALGIPYIDYARGDGRVVGPGGDPWHPVLVDEDTGWVRDFRGLWGHDARDRLGGERGPAGPRYERDGTVRESWGDPVGWAGLGKVAPSPAVERELLEARSERLLERLDALDLEIARGREELQTAAAGLPPASPEVRGLAPEEERLLRLRMEATQLRDEQARVRASAASSAGGTDPHAHLQHRRLPLEPVSGLRSRFLAGWAVVSTPLMLMALAAVVTPATGVSWTVTAGVWLVFLLSIEGLARGRYFAVLGRILLVAVVLVALYYAVVDWRIVLATAATLGGWLLLLVNIRDRIRR